jgi:glycosyltransferase involved in cell wall biosynthesis
MLSGYDIICLSNTDWDGHITCKQQIMSRLGRQNRILYVNRPMSLLSPTTGREEFTARKQLVDCFRGIREVTANLFVGTPPVVLPLRFLAVSDIINSLIMGAWLKRAMKRLGIINPIFWTFLPETARLVDRFGDYLSIYHCVDEHSEWGVWWNPPSLVQARERELIKSVDLVITTSQHLRRRKAKFNSNCHFVPNAANFDLFSKATGPDIQVPSDLSVIPKPVIGYVGILGPDHIDIDWIEHAAKNLSYSFVFVGKKSVKTFDLSRLERLKNIHFMGFKEPNQLPGYLKGMDICLIPYVKNERIEAVFPLKLFEYLAAGKPVVARRTAELEPYSRIVSLVETAEEFLEAIKASLQNNSDARIKARVKAARANTWEARIETLSEIILKHQEARPQGPKC